MRRRFERTYEDVNGIKRWPEEELVGIPNDTELVSQLSQPLVKYMPGGKIQLESKADMRKRGVKSPDRADALILAFANACLVPAAVSSVVGLSEAERIHRYITGKTTRHPDQPPDRADRYIDFEE
jgi:hypothetical protein